MRNILYLLSFCSFLFACTTHHNTADTEGPAVVVSQSVQARVDSALKSLVDDGRVAGVSALIYEKNKEVYYNAFGFADREAGAPMDRNTIVRIYSMTKPVTGVALMQLYEKGAFQLDDPLEKYAPELTSASWMWMADIFHTALL